MIRRSDLKPCGTPAAYRRHLRDGTEPCQACREAENLRQRKGRAKPTPPVCGTDRGYRAHLAAGTEPCASCRVAHCATQEAYRLERERTVGDEVPHGLNRYGNYGCRCDVCRAAKAADNRRTAEARKRRAAAAGAP